MVAGEHYRRRLLESEFVQRAEELPHVSVDHRHGGVVGGDGLADLRVRVERVVGEARQRRGGDVVAVIGRSVPWDDVGDRMAPEIPARGDPGQMGLVKASGDEEGAVAARAQQLDHAARGSSVGGRAVVLGGSAPGERRSAPPPAAREQVRPRHAGFGPLVPGVVAYLRGVLPRKVVRALDGVLRNVPGHRVLVATVRDLADTGGEEAVFGEVLRQHRDVAERFAGPREVAVDAGGGRSASGEE